MRIMRFHSEDGCRLGVVAGDTLVDLTRLWADAPRDLADLLKAGAGTLEETAHRAKRATASQVLDYASVRPALPIERPGKFICLGLNYSDHVGESNYDRPTHPTLFMRAANSLVAHQDFVERPQVSSQLDYEAELAVVIGRPLRNASADDALDAVAGYTCFNDVSVRDYQRHSVQWTMGKNFDRTGAFGPVFVSSDELPRGASGLRIGTRVNGEQRQSDNTANMIFNVGETLSYISQGITLEPGDVIAMGTPAGVGHSHTPPKWLRAGDIVEVEIEGIGALCNPIADERRRSRTVADG
jgi:2-keto-4-pentenoate hydratase/2-oxohepta-3-ene-1,7-dioic acid hydratase in catechol pathway